MGIFSGKETEAKRHQKKGRKTEGENEEKLVVNSKPIQPE